MDGDVLETLHLLLQRFIFWGVKEAEYKQM